MNEPTKSSHGGPRPGGGRPKGEPTKVIRLPVRLAPVVQALVEAPPGTRMPHPDASRLSLTLFGHKVRAGFPSSADD